MRVLTAAVLALAIGLAIGPVAAQDRPALRCTWDAPIIGSPVSTYVVELWDTEAGERVWIGGTSFTAITIPDSVVDPARYYHARVSGYDQFGRQGEWSEPIIYFWDIGPPGPPLNFRWTEE